MRWILVCLIVSPWVAGCGTTRWTDTKRTATEQMLVSDAVDRAVSRIDLSVLTGQEIFLDTAYLGETVDKEYLISTFRQHILASRCILKDKRENAEFVVELRSGAIGTDRHDLLYGVPAITLPITTGVPGVPSALPEIALARRTDQQGVAKVAVFAYHRESGRPVWQSGTDVVASKAQDLWFFGAGPIQKGTIYDEPQFAGDNLKVPFVSGSAKKAKRPPPPARTSSPRVFNNPTRLAQEEAKPSATAIAEKKFPTEAPIGKLWESQFPEVVSELADAPVREPQPTARLLGPTQR